MELKTHKRSASPEFVSPTFRQVSVDPEVTKTRDGVAGRGPLTGNRLLTIENLDDTEQDCHATFERAFGTSFKGPQRSENIEESQKSNAWSVIASLIDVQRDFDVYWNNLLMCYNDLVYARNLYPHFMAFMELLCDFGELGCPDLYIDRMCFLLERCKALLRRMSKGQAKKAKRRLDWFLGTAYELKEDRRPAVFHRVALQEIEILRLRGRIHDLEPN